MSNTNISDYLIYQICQIFWYQRDKQSLFNMIKLNRRIYQLCQPILDQATLTVDCHGEPIWCDICDNVHRIDGPAMSHYHYDQEKKQKKELWYWHGQLLNH